MGDGLSRGCSIPPSVQRPSQDRPLETSGTVQISDAGRTEVYGVSLADVHGVVLTYMQGGSRGESEAELVAVERPEVLRRASIRNPFGLYVGFVPPNARRCKAVAMDAGGEPIGVASCRPYESLPPDAFILGGS